MRWPALSAAVVIVAALALSACGEKAERPATPPGTEAATAVDPGVSMPEDAPPQEEAIAADAASTLAPDGSAGPCLEDFGQDVAEDLVRRCIAVSPATRPPCNVQNPCQMIQDEIDRSCALFDRTGDARPAECEAA